MLYIIGFTHLIYKIKYKHWDLIEISFFSFDLIYPNLDTTKHYQYSSLQLCNGQHLKYLCGE